MVGAPETQFDLRFRALGVPVRVSPMFWLVSAMMGWRDQNLPLVALWIVCVFVSILVHEYGHALMARTFRESPSILLWGMGGLCYSQGERQTPWERLLVILAGPGAGFALAFLVMASWTVVRGVTPDEHLGVVAGMVGLGRHSITLIEKFHGFVEYFTYLFLVWINLLWGLVNLLPIWPLDGGQASQILLTLYDRSRGRRLSHIVSLMVSGMLAVWFGLATDQLFLTLFFAAFAFINYQTLQSLHQEQILGVDRDDWWRG